MGAMVTDLRSAVAPVGETRTGMSFGINGDTAVGTCVSLGVPDWEVVSELPIREAHRKVTVGVSGSLCSMLVMALLAGLVRIAGGELEAPVCIQADPQTAEILVAVSAQHAETERRP